MIGQINIGLITQNALNVTNPLHQIIWYSAMPNNTVDNAGFPSTNFIETTLQARVQPVNRDMIYQMNLEYTQEYKRFFVLVDDVKNTNRTLNVTSDFIQLNNEYYRVTNIVGTFNTNWIEFLAVLTDEIPQ